MSLTSTLITVVVVTILLILVLALKGAKSDPIDTDSEKSCHHHGGCCGGGHCQEEPSEEPTVVYFDDDELDSLAGKDPDSYDEEELALFREIASTIRDDERAEWYASLKHRGIMLPQELKEQGERPSKQ